MKSFIECIELTGRKVGRSNAFSDFLTFAVCALSMQEQEELYLQTAKSYTKGEMLLFSEAFASLVIEMENNGEGLIDCLGDYFMECSSSKQAGQFFTSSDVCDLMSRLTPPPPFSTINDPCCGSGRFFLATAKLRKYNLYSGMDISYQCCQMTLINLCLNGLYGTVEHMNTLSLEKWAEWEVKPHPKYKVPYIHKVDLNSKNIVPTIIEEAKTEEKSQENFISETIRDSQLTEFLNQIDCLL